MSTPKKRPAARHGGGPSQLHAVLKGFLVFLSPKMVQKNIKHLSKIKDPGKSDITIRKSAKKTKIPIFKSKIR